MSCGAANKAVPLLIRGREFDRGHEENPVGSATSEWGPTRREFELVNTERETKNEKQYSHMTCTSPHSLLTNTLIAFTLTGFQPSTFLPTKKTNAV